jgi:hypothetical protein
MQPFQGQRVQITGTMTSPSSPNATTSPGTLTGAAGTTPPEFQVTNVRPIGGTCP